jgi:isocitrate dehydrogenase kinase/phosphatase
VATIVGIISAIFALLGTAVAFYKKKAAREQEAREEIEKANAQLVEANKDQVGRLTEINEYRKARQEGLSPGDALTRAEKERK